MVGEAVGAIEMGRGLIRERAIGIESQGAIRWRGCHDGAEGVAFGIAVIGQYARRRGDGQQGVFHRWIAVGQGGRRDIGPVDDCEIDRGDRSSEVRRVFRPVGEGVRSGITIDRAVGEGAVRVDR